jgi:HPr kinase/phosphorylase
MNRGRSARRPPGGAAGLLPNTALVSGGLLRIAGLGVLINGDSGIGKSESALELISRGYRFVSDDVVEARRTVAGRVLGRSPSLTRHFMEIRGLGIINIKQIFGPRAVMLQSPIDLVITLHKWEGGGSSDRLGLKFPEDSILLGVRIPRLNIPVAPGRNIATLIEAACKVQRLRHKGYHASKEIVRKLERALLRRNRMGIVSREKR